MLFCVSCVTRICCLHFHLNENNASACRSWHRTAYAVCVQWILSKMYSHSFVTSRLNPWCHMDYFTDLLATFLDVDPVNHIAIYGRVRELSDSIKNILICVPKMNKAFTCLERHGGKWLMTKFSFSGAYLDGTVYKKNLFIVFSDPIDFNYINKCSTSVPLIKKAIQNWNDMMVNKWINEKRILIFWVNNPFIWVHISTI